GWRHSVELTPWKETYRITQDGDFSFESTTYQSYGAGTPDTDGNVEFLSDGFIRVTGIERTISHYSLFYVPISKYYVADGPKKYSITQEGIFSFESSIYQSFGAVTPDTEGNLNFLSDGFIRLTGIERTISHYSFFYVPISKYYVADGQKKYTLSRYFPDNTNV